jgi:hypothetical protein
MREKRHEKLREEMEEMTCVTLVAKENRELEGG